MPASSNVVEFTITFGSTERGSCGKTCRRACWLNLEAHPAQDESEVSLRICSRDMFSHLLCGIGVPADRIGWTPMPLKKRRARNRTYLGPGSRNRQRF